jgi:hypothetical protein
LRFKRRRKLGGNSAPLFSQGGVFPGSPQSKNVCGKKGQKLLFSRHFIFNRPPLWEPFFGKKKGPPFPGGPFLSSLPGVFSPIGFTLHPGMNAGPLDSRLRRALLGGLSIPWRPNLVRTGLRDRVPHRLARGFQT